MAISICSLEITASHFIENAEHIGSHAAQLLVAKPEFLFKLYNFRQISLLLQATVTQQAQLFELSQPKRKSKVSFKDVNIVLISNLK